MVRREKETVNCGTARGYRRHKYIREEACDSCRQANNKRARDAYRAKYGYRESARVTIADYLETFGTVTILDLVALIQERHDISEVTIRRSVSRMVGRGALVALRDPPQQMYVRLP